jgi:hypothetical protein
MLGDLNILTVNLIFSVVVSWIAARSLLRSGCLPYRW